MTADLNTGLFAWLKSVSAVTTLIGTGDNTRAYPSEAQSTPDLPYIVYDAEKDSEDQIHNGAATTAHSRVTFSCRATSTSAATALATAVADALRSFRSGLMGGVTINWLVFLSSSPAYQWDTQQFSADVECEVWYVL